MADGFRFVPDPAGIEEVATGPAVAPALNAAANKAAMRMRALAPRGFLGFKGRIRMEPARKTVDGYVAYAGSDSPGWHLQEYGTSKTKARATLRRGIKAAGIRFEEGK